MIKEEDLLLSKMSYTDKDFASIYPDLLDLAKQLTNKWDPSLSNESDPGVVLLKEGAFIADHGNYNIDKNILENFLPTATQESSVRNILDMNGYTPGYYITASGDISFTYKPEDSESFVSFNIPEFTLVVTDVDNSVFYTQVSPLVISQVDLATSATFMEGTKKSLEINGNTTILLENLDDNNRIYFPIKQVAENGIFIKNVATNAQDEGDYWVKTNYISTQPLNSKVYKVGYDSSLGVPYVEFPSDIANIIGSGLTIDYIATNGDYGNVKANTLTQISTPTQFTTTNGSEILAEDFTLSNPTSIMNGKDPETINEMYKSFKKVVGTFDTLVTCKDYSNAIYTATDDSGNNKLVSNAVVTDRNNDYNNAIKIITYDQYGEYFEIASKLLNMPGFNLKPTKPEVPSVCDIIFQNGAFYIFQGYNPITGAEIWLPISHISYKDFMNTIEAMTPYDLGIYCLKAFSLSDYLTSTPYSAIEKSFKPIDAITRGEVYEFLGTNKCINHDFLETDEGEVICFKNYVPLNITITPYSKVTKQEKEEIINNIYKALSANFNAAKVDFGEELNYDEVLQVLLDCDDRIKNIRLEDFEYNPKAMLKDTTLDGGYREVSLYDTNDAEGFKILLDVIAKNILAGRVCLFDFDDEFTLKYGQIENKKYNNLASIRTEVEIKADQNAEVSTTNIKAVNTKVYSKYNGITTKICITSTIDGQAGRVEIPVDGDYVLGSTEKLYIDIKGVMKEYTSDAAEHELVIQNHTVEDIYIEYNGTARENWYDLKDGYISLVSTYSVTDEETYNLIYKPKDNEYIEIAYNNYTTDATFPTYVKYRFTATNAADDYYVPANTDHILGADETLLLIFTENDEQSSKEYRTGEVIRPNFDMVPTDKSTTKGITVKVDDMTEVKYLTLTASQRIEHRQLMKTELTSTKVPCYWIVNNNSNTLFFNADGEHARTNSIILSSGEYFVYSNANKDSMVILGPGTKLTRSETDKSNWSIPNKITFKDINENGFNANIEWKYIDFDNGNNFSIQEMNIVTLSKGDELKIKDWGSTSELIINNNWTECNGTIAYTLSSESSDVKLPTLPEGENYLIKSRLDIALNNNTGQILKEGQKFIINCEDSIDEITIAGSDANPIYLQSSADINLYGDSAVDLTAYTTGSLVLNLNEYKLEKPILHIKNYVAQYTGLIDVDTQYYKVTNNRYVEIPKTEVAAIIATGITYFTELYEVYPDTLWYVDEGYLDTTLEQINGKYIFNLSNPGYAEFKFGYYCDFNVVNVEDTTVVLSDDHREYILPVFLNHGGSDITAKIDDITGKYTVQVQDYNIGEPVDNMQLTNSEMYLIRVCIDATSTVTANLKLTLSWDDIPTEPEILTILDPAVVNGINQGIGFDITLGKMLSTISDIVSGSTKPNTKPYYIYKPEDSIAIQDPTFENANVFWDTNNIINHLMIPQVDIRTMADKNYPTIDIIKSMRNYK